jgi:hypothetical protein
VGLVWQRDAKVDHRKEASVRDLRYDFKKIERLLRQGEERTVRVKLNALA